MGIDGSLEAFHLQCRAGSCCSQAVTFREYGVYRNITADGTEAGRCSGSATTANSNIQVSL